MLKTGTYEVVRIEPDPEHPDVCRVGWRSPEAFLDPLYAAARATSLADDKGVYMAVAAGGDPLADPSCLVISVRAGTGLALPF